MKKIMLYLLLGMLVQSCGSLKKVPKPSADDVVIKIIQINDVYEIDAINNGKKGGLARVAYIHDSISHLYPNTYFFLAGDFVNPSLLGTIKVDNERLQGKQMVEVLNLAGLDLTTFGNHEFDIKEADLQKRLNESNFKWTSANTLHVTKDGVKPFEKYTASGVEPVSDYEIYHAKSNNGKEAKFAVVGVTIPSNPKDYVFYGDIYKDFNRAYKIAAQQSDFVLGLTHVSIEEDKTLARLNPGIALIMGGHEHYNMKYKVKKTIITKADANVTSLYLHTLLYNTKTKSVKVFSELVKVDDKYPFKPAVQDVVTKWNHILDENLKTIIENPNEVIYNAVDPLDGTDVSSRSKQTNLGTLICKAMSYVYNDTPDGVITNGGGIRIDDKVAGAVTGKDVFRIMPFGGSVLLVDMTGKLLKEVLDFGNKAIGNGAYLQRYNIAYSKDKWTIKNQVIDDEKVYTIALNDFLMLGKDIPFLTPENPGVKKVQRPQDTDGASDIRKTVVKYLKALK